MQSSSTVSSEAEDKSGAVVLAALSAVSGAIGGFLITGDFGRSLVLFLTVPVCLAIGWWARGLRDR